MAPIPLLELKEVVRTFEKLGWQTVRQRGSHIILVKEGHIATLSVPNHPQVARCIAKLDRQSRNSFGRVFKRLKILGQSPSFF